MVPRPSCPFRPPIETFRSHLMLPYPVSLLLMQAVSASDTLIAKTIPVRDTMAWATSVLQIVLLLLGIGVAIATIFVLMALRKGIQQVEQKVSSLTKDTQPLIQQATAIVGDARGIVAVVRRDVQHLSHSAGALSDQLLGAADTTMQRVNDVNAVLDVLQAELEDTAISAVSTLRGVRVGAEALGARLAPRRRKTVKRDRTEDSRDR